MNFFLSPFMLSTCKSILDSLYYVHPIGYIPVDSIISAVLKHFCISRYAMIKNNVNYNNNIIK